MCLVLTIIGLLGELIESFRNKHDYRLFLRSVYWTLKIYLNRNNLEYDDSKNQFKFGDYRMYFTMSCVEGIGWTDISFQINKVESNPNRISVSSYHSFKLTKKWIFGRLLMNSLAWSKCESDLEWEALVVNQRRNRILNSII